MAEEIPAPCASKASQRLAWSAPLQKQALLPENLSLLAEQTWAKEKHTWAHSNKSNADAGKEQHEISICLSTLRILYTNSAVNLALGVISCRSDYFFFRNHSRIHKTEKSSEPSKTNLGQVPLLISTHGYEHGCLRMANVGFVASTAPGKLLQ